MFKQKLITYEKTYKGLPINNSSGLGCYTDMLETAYRILKYAAQKRKRNRAFIFVVRFTQGKAFTNPNALFRSFIAKLIRNLTRKGLDPVYLWTREREDSVNPHFNVFILLDDDPNLESDLDDLLATAESLWASTLGIDYQGGLLYPCNTGAEHELLDRTIPDCRYEQLCGNLFYWLSYACKVSQKKGEAPANHHTFGGSIIA